MKTIRPNCFETNSSSTHSITISFNGVTRMNDGLVKDNGLIPENLVNSTAYTTPGCYSDSRILTCRTKDQKAALFVHHMEYFKNSPPYNFGKKRAEMLAEYSYDILKSICGYNNISLEFCPSFYYSADNEDSYMDLFMKSLDTDDCIKDKIYYHIANIIMNDAAIIHDVDESN